MRRALIFVVLLWPSLGWAQQGMSVTTPPTPIATTSVPGKVMPDGDTLAVASDGTLSCNTFTALVAGCVPASGGGTSDFARADGTWAPAAITQLTGDVTAGPGTGSQAATLADTAVTPGSYTLASITVDAKGRITAASNGTGCSPPSDGRIVYAASGACAGDANLTWDATNQILQILGSTAGAGHNYALAVVGGVTDGTHIAAKFADSVATMTDQYTSIGYGAATSYGDIAAFKAGSTTAPLMLNNHTGFATVYAGCGSQWNSDPGGIVGCNKPIGGGGSGGAMVTGIAGGGQRFIAEADGSGNGSLGLARGLDPTGTFHALIHSSGESYFNGGIVSFGGSGFTGVSGEVGLLKIAASGTAPGSGGAKLAVVCGTGAGTAKLIMYAGTSTTPTTVVDNVGGGVSGC